MQQNKSSVRNKYKILSFLILILIEAFVYMIIIGFVKSNIWLFLVFTIYCIANFIQFLYIKDLLQKNNKKFESEIQYKELEIANQKEEFELHNEQLNVYLEEITVFAEEKNKFVKELEKSQKELLEKEAIITTLLNNAGQGFLAFNSNLLVYDEYSSECHRIFGEDIARKFFPSLIHPNNEEDQKLLVSMFNDIFTQRPGFRREVFISLLPKEIFITDKNIKIEYKVVSSTQFNPVENTQNEMIMVILTDITESRKLEELMESEKNTFRMIVKVLTSRSDFLSCLNDFYSFCNTVNKDNFRIDAIGELAAASDISIDDRIFSFCREIHKFKGVFSQLSLIHIPKKLHEIETRLGNIINSPNDKSMLLAEFINEINLAGLINDDISTLKKYLSQSFFNNEDAILIDRKSIKRVEQKMLTLLKPDDYKILLPELRKLRYIKAKELVQNCADYFEKISLEYEKNINPLVVEGGDFLIDPEKYHAFSQSLVHIFRNVVAHGIESADERIMAGKDEFANVTCKITLNNNKMMISISDDGRGIDTEKVLKIAVEKGIVCDKEKVTDKEITLLIFNDGFSTSSAVTDLSGRGLGLSSVKKEVDILGGYIEINTQKSRGTTFNFFLPYEAIDYTPIFSPSDM